MRKREVRIESRGSVRTGEDGHGGKRRKKNTKKKNEKGKGEKEKKKDGITSRWTRRLAFTVSEASVVANGERRISDWRAEGERAGKGSARLSGTVGQFKPKIQKVN